jgi:hypothetical protein
MAYSEAALMRSTLILAALFCLGSLFALPGCNKKPAAPATAGTEHHHEHGPHDGELIEIGKEEYHAELVKGENGVTIYMLDKEGKKAVPIAAEPIAISIIVNAQPVEFSLEPKPLEGEQAGQSSRFESSKPELGVALDNPEAKRELRLKIGEKPYVAPFEHFDH